MVIEQAFRTILGSRSKGHLKSTCGFKLRTVIEQVNQRPQVFSRSSPLHNRTYDLTMGNGNSTGQGNYTTYGSRDVGRSVEQGQHWPSELAEASNMKKSNSLFSPDQKPHSCCMRFLFSLQTRLLTFYYYFLTFIFFIVEMRSVNFFIKRIFDWIGLLVLISTCAAIFN